MHRSWCNSVDVAVDVEGGEEGKSSLGLQPAETLARFIGERLAGYEPRGNDEIKAKLDELLADDCALAKDFRERRASE